MRKVLARLLMLIPAVALQLLWYFLLFSLLYSFAIYLQILLFILTILILLFIINKRDEPNYKLMWIIVIMIFPFVGTWMYLASGNKRAARIVVKKIDRNKADTIFKKTQSIADSEFDDDKRFLGTLEMAEKLTGAVPSKAVNPVFYRLGDYMYKDLLSELKRAEKFIYMEYFIISDGEFWQSVVEILEQKVKEGVDVRVLYDDIGSISTFSKRDRRRLISKGIKCEAFNALVFIKMTLNNRDHRKMTIIDNRVCFSGGVNIGDEYINKKSRFGHWKDIGFKFSGEGVLDYTRMFVLFWNSYSKDKIDMTKLYMPDFAPDKKGNSNKIGENSGGYIFSYYDSPASEEPVSNKLFIDLLAQAEKTAYFYTPYLIIPDSLKEAFIQAASRGVDIRIIIPGIPDKKLIYKFTLSYAEELSKHGVKIYKYTPGFLHAKACIIDEKICTVGSVNLDYRSLYLHFECNSVFYNSDLIKELKNDFLTTQSQSRYMETKELHGRFFGSIFGMVLKIFAPLC